MNLSTSWNSAIPSSSPRWPRSCVSTGKWRCVRIDLLLGQDLANRPLGQLAQARMLGGLVRVAERGWPTMTLAARRLCVCTIFTARWRGSARPSRRPRGLPRRCVASKILSKSGCSSAAATCLAIFSGVHGHHQPVVRRRRRREPGRVWLFEGFARPTVGALARPLNAKEHRRQYGALDIIFFALASLVRCGASFHNASPKPGDLAGFAIA